MFEIQLERRLYTASPCFQPHLPRRQAQWRLGPKSSNARDLTPDEEALINDAAYWTAECGAGAGYDVQTEDLRKWQPRYSVSHSRRGISLPLPLSEVHAALAWHLRQRPNEHQSIALLRLSTAFAVPKSGLTPDLFIKAANDLDVVLFGGVLSQRTLISWEDLSTQNGRLLRGTCLGGKLRFKVQIKLDRACFFVDSKEVLWGTLVHEMLHAYVDITWAGSGPRGVANQHEHDEHFAQSVARLAERLAFPGLGSEEIMRES